ncbi:MAG: hypothetical protein HXS48_20280, partial [Theionarchaea archaeon]|nr:hypothetical protein [Theionarchaea archaeon]
MDIKVSNENNSQQEEYPCEEDQMSLYELKDNKRRILPLFPSADHHLAMEAV